MFKLYVKNQYLEFIDKELATTDSENYYKIQFEFDESWDNFVKHASFFNTTKGQHYVKQITATNELYVPNEVLKAKLPIYIGLYGIDANGVRVTTNTLQIPVAIGAYIDNPTIVDNNFTEPLEFVKTEEDRIKLIRERNGIFEYSLDGIRWSQVRGEAGLGLPSGGEIGQYLAKSTINDYETEWKSFDNEINENSQNGASSKGVVAFVNSYVEGLAIDIVNIKDLFNR